MEEYSISSTFEYDLTTDFVKYRHLLQQQRGLQQTRDNFGKHEAEFRDYGTEELEISVLDDRVNYHVPDEELSLTLPGALLEGCELSSVTFAAEEQDDAWMTLTWDDNPPAWMTEREATYLQSDDTPAPEPR